MMKDEATAVIPAVVTTVDPRTQCISEKEMTEGLRKLLCSNAKIFEETVRFLGEQNARLHEQVAGLTQLSLAVQCKAGEASISTVEVFNQAEDMRKLTRINMQMFEGTIRVLDEQNARMRDQISVLTSDLLALLRPTAVIGACSKQDEP
jgi:hypothetical protein